MWEGLTSVASLIARPNEKKKSLKKQRIIPIRLEVCRRSHKDKCCTEKISHDLYILYLNIGTATCTDGKMEYGQEYTISHISSLSIVPFLTFFMTRLRIIFVMTVHCHNKTCIVRNRILPDKTCRLLPIPIFRLPNLSISKFADNII